jgi:hypothetical protein
MKTKFKLNNYKLILISILFVLFNNGSYSQDRSYATFSFYDALNGEPLKWIGFSFSRGNGDGWSVNTGIQNSVFVKEGIWDIDVWEETGWTNTAYEYINRTFSGGCFIQLPNGEYKRLPKVGYYTYKMMSVEVKGGDIFSVYLSEKPILNLPLHKH